MSTVAEVFLWGTRIGTVALPDGATVASFEYDPSFLPSGVQVSPITMPLSGRVFSFPALPEQSFRGLPGLLADSLPDKFGNAVIDAWLESQGRPRGSLNAVERLCYTGSRGMGALEYVPALGPSSSAADALDVAALTDLAERILAQRESLQVSEGDQTMAQIMRVGTSAGGARAKALVALNEQTGDIRSGQVSAGPGYTYWLLKFDGLSSNADKEQNDGPCYTSIEYAYHLMAKMAGVIMMECRLYDEGSRHHFMTRRFDRTENGGKLHMQTLGGLAHFDFNNPGAHSYEEAVSVMRLLGLGQDEVEQLFLRMVFNVAVRNQDDHVKNISFIMDRSGAWSLAPAYDVTYAYNPGGAWTGSHQMTVNGKRDGIEVSDLIDCARHMSIRPARAKWVIEAVVDATRSWRRFAEAAGVPERQAEAIYRTFCLVGSQYQLFHKGCKGSAKIGDNAK